MDQLLALNGPLCHANSEMLKNLILFNGIEVITNAKVKLFAEGILIYELEGMEKIIVCDSVIMAVGYKKNDFLYKKLEFNVSEIYLLGDAKKVSNIMYGIWDAYEVANHI